MEEVTIEDTEEHNSSIKWEVGQRGGIGFSFREFPDKPLNKEFLTKNLETLDWLLQQRTLRFVEKKVKDAKKEELSE